MLFVIFWDSIRQQRKPVSSNENVWLNTHGADTVIEIGVFEAVTTRVLAESGTGFVYGVDTFPKGRLGISWQELISRHNIHKSPARERIQLLVGTSEMAQKLVYRPDMIFIDGDHSEVAIARDWQIWSEIVSPGGIVALHDTRVCSACKITSDMGSLHYFESAIRKDSRFKLVEQVDSLSVLRRLAAP